MAIDKYLQTFKTIKFLLSVEGVRLIFAAISIRSCNLKAANHLRIISFISSASKGTSNTSCIT